MSVLMAVHVYMLVSQVADSLLDREKFNAPRMKMCWPTNCVPNMQYLCGKMIGKTVVGYDKRHVFPTHGDLDIKY